jgi:hypothetical protein
LIVGLWYYSTSPYSYLAHRCCEFIGCGGVRTAADQDAADDEGDGSEYAEGSDDYDDHEDPYWKGGFGEKGGHGGGWMAGWLAGGVMVFVRAGYVGS